MVLFYLFIGSHSLQDLVSGYIFGVVFAVVYIPISFYVEKIIVDPSYVGKIGNVGVVGFL